MPRQQYVNANRRPKSQNRGQFLLVLISFATGYLSSSIMNINQLGNWMNENLAFGDLNIPIAKSHAPATQLASNAADKKVVATPKLEFYTVLTQNSKVSVPVGTELSKMVKPTKVATAQPQIQAKAQVQPQPPKTVEVESAKPIFVQPEVSSTAKASASGTKKTIFVVQLASFRYREQAERLRAKLLMKGFDAKISEARQGNAQLFRVMLGPYANLSEAQKAKVVFQAKEHSSGMIRQMDA